ncbi:MAG: hypothetical protein ACTS6G_04230 [Candidatus Hodgkinia cicadicola]
MNLRGTVRNVLAKGFIALAQTIAFGLAVCSTVLWTVTTCSAEVFVSIVCMLSVTLATAVTTFASAVGLAIMRSEDAKEAMVAMCSACFRRRL